MIIHDHIKATKRLIKRTKKFQVSWQGCQDFSEKPRRQNIYCSANSIRYCYKACANWLIVLVLVVTFVPLGIAASKSAPLFEICNGSCSLVNTWECLLATTVGVVVSWALCLPVIVCEFCRSEVTKGVPLPGYG